MFLFDKNISGEILDRTKLLFTPNQIQDALALLAKGNLTVSFKKGSFETFLILTGIIQDATNYETKIVYKKRLEGSEEGPFSSNCTCDAWSEDKHCAHACAFYVLTSLEESRSKDSSEDEQNDFLTKEGIHPPSHKGVGVDKFGTIIKNPYRLINASPKSTYASLNYCLTSGKVANLTIPSPIEGKIVLSFEDNSFSKAPVFYHRKTDGSLRKKISIFEKLYLFDWEDGIFYSLTPEIRIIIERFLNEQHFDYEVLINKLRDLNFKSFFEISIGDTSLEKINYSQGEIRLNIDKNSSSAAKNIKISIETVAQDGKFISSPNLFKYLSFDSDFGFLNFFKTKNDGSSFLSRYLYSLKTETHFSRSEISFHPRRNTFQNILDLIDTCKEYFFFDTDSHLWKIDLSDFKKILILLEDLYSKNVFKTLDIINETNQLTLTISKSQFFDHLFELKENLSSQDIELTSNKIEIKKWDGNITVTREKKDRGWFDLNFDLSTNDLQIISQADITKGLSIVDDKYYILTDEQKKLFTLIKRYLDESNEKTDSEKKDSGRKNFYIPFNRARIFELVELNKLGISDLLTEEETQIVDKLTNLESLPDYELPENLDSTLRTYQKTGYQWLRFLHEFKFGACLADDMGLGKTLQVISFLQSIHRADKKYLIVCPVSIILNWEQEFKKFSSLPVSVYHGPGRNKDAIKHNIILTSYGVLKKEYDSDLLSQVFEVIVMDEVQSLKNIRSLGAVAARQLKSNFNICLTGTPVENDLNEFFNIIDLSIPGVWGNLQFVKRNKHLKEKVMIRHQAKPFILRRTKNQVLKDLPDKIEQRPYLQFSKDEEDFYFNLNEIIKSEILTAPKSKKYGIILKGLLKLRQSCLWQPKDEETIETSSPQLKDQRFISSKIRFLISQLEQILDEGHQVLVFSQFTSYLDLIQSEIEHHHWSVSRIDGSYSVPKRQKQIESFQKGENKIFLISLKAGGVGLNLTAANYVFIMDPWWNPAVENQAIDRAYRIGQNKKVTVYRPLIKGSVEEKILELQLEKKALFDQLLGGEGSDDVDMFSGKLSMKDFEYILGTDGLD